MRFKFAAVAAPLFVFVGAAHAQTVYSNAIGGDSYSGPIPTTLIGSSGWAYTDVRADTTVGIDTWRPNNGNGSVHFNTTSGTGKADITYLFSPNAGLKLSNLNSLSYDWYRSSTSTSTGHLHPSLRVLFDADGDVSTLGDRGALIFEMAYNGGGVMTDTWTSSNIFGMDAYLWMNNPGNPNGGIQQVYNRRLSDWLSTPNPNNAYPSLGANTLVLGINSGVGSGWSGTFDGAVDNISIGFTGGPSYAWNFEAAGQPVPEPMTMALMGLGAAAMVRRKLAKK